MSVAIVTRASGRQSIIATVPERIAHRDRDRQPGEEGYELHQPRYWRLVMPYPDRFPDHETLHRMAAEKLAERLEWSGPIAGGALPDGYAWVFCEGAR